MSTVPTVSPSGPACPGCQKRPFTHDMIVNRFPNGVLVSVNYCRDCGHIIGTFMCGAEEPKIAPVPGPRLVS